MPSLCVDITNRDIRAALEAWERAETQGAPAERVALLWGDVERICRTQAWQLLDVIEASTSPPHAGPVRYAAGRDLSAP